MPGWGFIGCQSWEQQYWPFAPTGNIPATVHPNNYTILSQYQLEIDPRTRMPGRVPLLITWATQKEVNAPRLWHGHIFNAQRKNGSIRTLLQGAVEKIHRSKRTRARPIWREMLMPQGVMRKRNQVQAAAPGDNGGGRQWWLRRLLCRGFWWRVAQGGGGGGRKVLEPRVLVALAAVELIHPVMICSSKRLDMKF